MVLSATDILNYSVRVGIVIIGILFLSIPNLKVPGDPTFTTWIGTAFIVFGSYRSVMYYHQAKKRNAELSKDDHENDN